MYIQMSATRMQTVKQIRSGYKRTYYIIIAAKFRKVKEDLLVLITLHFKEKNVRAVIAALRMLYLLYSTPDKVLNCHSVLSIKQLNNVLKRHDITGFIF